MDENALTLLKSIYVDSTFSQCRNLFSRIDFLTSYFLSKPYLVNPQGEGENAEIDSAPLYRLDGFDCVTYVNTVLALALSHDEHSFLRALLKINYYDATPLFQNRFHFMSVDWNPQNQKNSILRDITKTIVDEKNKPIYRLAEGEIDRPGWFLKRAEKADSLRAAALRKMAVAAKKEFAALPYLPLATLFDENQLPPENYFAQFPSVCVLEIVRPNWQLSDKIGTNLHVSHVGFAIRKPSGELFFRHASSEQKCVVEIRLSDYLRHYLDSLTIKGIHLEAIF